MFALNEVVKTKREVDTFGYALSNLKCRSCNQRMYVVAYGMKRYGSMEYGFEGYKCAFCGHEHIEHVSGGVLGNVKK